MTKKKLHPNEREKALKEAIRQGKITPVYLDLETSLMTVRTFYTGHEVSIRPHQIDKESKIITIQWMFEKDSSPSYLVWTNKNGKQEDKTIIETFIKTVLDKPNLLVIGQNHKKFDYKVLAERAKKNQNSPMDLSNILTLDTLNASRASFRAPSHRLDYRSKEYGFGGKIEMEYEDWVKVENGDERALKKMIKYGCKDVTDLRKIFWRELPYYISLPAPLDRLLRESKERCRKCFKNKQASYDIKESGKHFVCNKCGDKWES